MTAPPLEARKLVRIYRDPVTRRSVKAVDGISLVARTGDVLGILGASGAGKSTLTRLLLGLESPDGGRVLYDGVDLERCTHRQRRSIRYRVQAVFQDPRSSLNPALTVGTIVSEPLRARGGIDRRSRDRRIAESLAMVGLPASYGDRRPEQLSGGERQRVAIARAIAPDPDLLVLDEPVSSLDGPVRGQVLNLLDELRATLGLTIILVTHDVRSITTLANRVLVMYAGRSVEEGSTAEVLGRAGHPYTRALLDAVPRPGTERSSSIDPSSQAESGCACRTWCPLAERQCRDRPELRPRGDNHRVACWVV